MADVIFVDESDRSINMIPLSDVRAMAGDLSAEEFEAKYGSDIQQLNRDITGIRFENDSDWLKLRRQGYVPVWE